MRSFVIGNRKDHVHQDVTGKPATDVKQQPENSANSPNRWSTNNLQPISDLERCDLEIAEIYLRPDLASSPAYLSAMGHADWLLEKLLIKNELLAIPCRRSVKEI